VTGIDIAPWEPEESIGKLWHALASRLDAPLVNDGARVNLSEVGGRLAVLFRGLSGSPAVDVRAAPEETSHHRLGLLRRLATPEERVPRASFDGETLRLPESLGVLPTREANAALYVWLAACAAHAGAAIELDDPLQADLAAIAAARRMVALTLEAAPGFRALHADLCRALLVTRPVLALPPAEAAVEALVRQALGDDTQVSSLAMPQHAPRGYHPFRPVPLWPDLRRPGRSEASTLEMRATDGRPEEGEGSRTHRARRRKSDQAERKDSFILHKFEALLSWTEFVNLNRRVEDDDSEDAKKAANDQEEIGLGQISKAPATRLKLHLDLAPEDVDREALSGVFTYPEWEVRSSVYLKDHVRVLASRAEAHGDATAPCFDPKARARILAVKRQFEALRPARLTVSGCVDGDDLDMDRTVRARADLLATGDSDDRIWTQARPQKRDLAVSILLDVSRSTESALPGHGHDGRSVIDIEREALAALSWGLDACGDDFAINAFSSLKRDRVYVQNAKSFGEPMTGLVEQRIASLKPGFYTRLGAAIRHASAGLSAEARRRRLLLVITDGKPNDLDHYEGRHGIEDSHMAVREARMAGHAVFGITVDRDGKAWFPRIFGQGAFALVPHAEKLTQVLPAIYRQLVAG
jgi:nitric oxide reductase NorD protein